MTRYESERKRQDCLYEQQREQEAEEKARVLQELGRAKIQADAKLMAVYAAKRQAAEAEKQELQRQRELEEKQDLETKPGFLKARLKLVGDLGTVCKTYKKLVSNFTDTNFGKTRTDPKYLHDGWILGGLIKLTDCMAQPFKRSEDTYHCCALLRDCTCYLACDEKYKIEGRLSKDDRFAGIYKANPNFRREWIAFLRQLVGYVEMLYEDEDEAKKL